MNNSLSAYFDEGNQRKFKSDKAKIVRLLKSNPNHSRFYVGDKLGINSHAAQKRLSDLVNEGTIFVSGERKHGNNTVSLYSIVEQLELFQEPKKLTYKQQLKQIEDFLEFESPNLLHKYKALYCREL